MTGDSGVGPAARALARRLVLPLRRVVAPAALELPDHLAALRQQAADDVRDLRAELADLREENAALRARLDAVDARADELRDGLHEQRRLNLRIAELTDVVTELVLPLHDREIDAEALRSLRPEAL